MQKNLFYLFSYLLFLSSTISKAQIISTAAGGNMNFRGEGGAAINAEINPRKIKVTNSGSIFFIDFENTVRKITENGIFKTIGEKRSENFEYSTFDSYGNLYYSDLAQNMIFKIDTLGNRTKIAGTGGQGYSGDGGLAINARLETLAGITTDKAGNIYFSQVFDNVIRKINKDGIITTIAGVGGFDYSGDGGPAKSAHLEFVLYLHSDDIGNLYLSEYYHNSIRKIDTSGIINTIAGNGSSNESGDGGPAKLAGIGYSVEVSTDAFGNVFIPSNNRVRKIDTSGFINTIIGNGTYGFSGDGGTAIDAQFRSNMEVTVDAVGNIYIPDAGNYRIRKVNTSNIVSTIAGNGLYSFSGDGGPAIDAALGSSSSIAVDKLKNLYIADGTNNVVRKVNSSGIINTVAGNKTNGFSGDGNLSINAQLSGPSSICVDSSNKLYIVESGNSRIRMVNQNGIISTIAGTGISGNTGDNGPAKEAKINAFSIATDKQGNVYFSDLVNNLVRKISIHGVITRFAGNGTKGFSGDSGVALDAQFSSPGNIALDDSGNVFINDCGNNRVRKVNKEGIISTIAGNGISGYVTDDRPATSTNLNFIGQSGITIDRFGNIYLSLTNNHEVKKINKAGIIS